MTTAKMETSAQKYRRIKAEKAKDDVLYPVECECGMTWQAKRFQIDFWIASGILPMGLVEKMVSSVKKAGAKPEDVLKTMATDEIFKSVAFASKVVRHTAVEPRIVETVVEENDISQEEVMTCCYKRLLDWQMQGGESGLDTFRN